MKVFNTILMASMGVVALVMAMVVFHHISGFQHYVDVALAVEKKQGVVMAITFCFIVIGTVLHVSLLHLLGPLSRKNTAEVESDHVDAGEGESQGSAS